MIFYRCQIDDFRKRKKLRCGQGQRIAVNRVASRGVASKIRRIDDGTAMRRGHATRIYTMKFQRERVAADRTAGDRLATFTIANRCACPKRIGPCFRIKNVITILAI